MPQYWPLKYVDDETTQARVIDTILALRAALSKQVGPSRKPGSLLLATWNIREFGRKKTKHGPRIEEAFHYLAEIISHFQLVALQEVDRNLDDFEHLMKLLGPDWSCLLTDTTEGRAGNGERMAFVYDKRAVRFRNVAGEIVLPVGHRVAADTDADDELQFARTPFLAGFQAGWFKFNLCTVHIYYGADRGTKLARRVSEIEAVAKFFKKRQRKEVEDYILLGDFNIVSPEHKTMQALEKHGFRIPENLKRQRTNLKGDKHYDQIALKPARKMVEIGASGVFDFEKVCFRSDQRDVYAPLMPKAAGKTGGALTREYNRWRTFQISDHLPMWVEIEIDFTEDYLNSLRPGKKVLADG